MWQGTCLFVIFFVEKENGGGGLSPSWTSNFEKSIVFASSLGHVPVFNLPMLKPSSLRERERFTDGISPALPPGKLFSPIWIRPLKKVPVVITTAFALKISPIFVSTPQTLLSFVKIFSSNACLI